MATNTVTQQPLTSIISDITFEDTGTITLGTKPVGAVLVDLKAYVSTPFNSGTSDSLSIGHAAYGSTAADTDEFEAAIDLQAAGNASLTILQLGQVISSTDAVDITATITSDGAAATAGEATIIFTYAQK